MVASKSVTVNWRGN